MATPSEAFEKATKAVKELKTRPSNEDLLKLYANYKQATEGDVNGKKPGMLDLKGRKKYEAWESIKGKPTEKAQEDYVQLVTELGAKEAG